MKERKTTKILVLLLLLVSICLSATVSAFAAAGASGEASQSANAASKVTEEFDSVLYEEDFDDEGNVSFTSGQKNQTTSAGTWYYTKGKTTSTGSASIKDGRLYFSGNTYDYMYLVGGEDWKNYTLELDFCYNDTKNTGWIGVMYNVIELSGGGVMAQKGGTLLNGNAGLNGTSNLVGGESGWSNNSSQNATSMKNLGLTVPAVNNPIRIKITTYENTAALYYAFLDNSGNMTTPYIKIMSIDNIPTNAQQGSIGLMTCKSTALGSCWVDNIKCQKLLYEESFDGITEKVNVATGSTKYDAVEGWIYNKHNGGNGVAYVQDGKLYMTGGANAYDVLYRNNGQNWKNYTVEADFCYTESNSSNGWGAMMYNVQSATKFQKGGITTTGAATLNGYNNGWSNNNPANSNEPTKNHYQMPSGAPGNNAFRLKISTYNETAALYYAMLDANGKMTTPFIHVMTIDNIPADARSGSIGFMTSAWGNLGSFWVDNIRCYENVIVNYSESFDNVKDRVEIQPGINTFGAANGWIYNKKSTDSKAYIENGRLYFSGSKYDVIYRDGGEVWGNYTLEADYCFTSTTGWGGILYNVQDSGNKFQKAGITTGGLATLNGNEGGIWTNNDSETPINHHTMTTTVPKKDEPFRMKVCVYNKTATLYYALLDTSGNMTTPYIKVMSIDNIPADNQTGSIGLMTSNNSYASFWVDNIKCYSETLTSYSEDFNSYANYEIAGNAIDKTVGFYFDQNGTSAADSKAEVKDGALYLYGGTGSYDALFFTTGDNWTNYVVESDFTYLNPTSTTIAPNNNGWAGILFRSNDINNFYKGLVELPDSVYEKEAGKGALNGKLNNQWYMNDLTATRSEYSGTVALNTTYRLRIVVNENTASLYIATYTNGALGDWIRVVTITDRFAPIHMKGTIGLIVGGGNDSKYRNIKIDNVTVSQIPGADRMYEEPNAADIYECETGIVNPPVVVEKLTSTLPATEGERAAVVMMKIDANLNVLDKNGEKLTTVQAFIDTYRKVLIPAFVVDNEAEADALAALALANELQDAYVMATAENASLVKRVRLANETTNLMSGAIIFEDLNSLAARQNARATVSDNMSYVAISKAPISEEAAFYFAVRQIAAWSFADSTAEVYRGIANGYHGIVSENVSEVYDVYESITATTVSGKTVVIAHRGANDLAETPYPENTLMGIRAAKEIWGVAAAELDFCLTKDGYVVLMHDDTVDKTTDGTGKVSELTLEQIKALNVTYPNNDNKYFIDENGKNVKVPTLDEVLKLAKELDIVLYCHVKGVTDANIAAFTHLVEMYDCSDNVILFAATENNYNSNTDRVYTGTAYKLNNSPVVPEGIVFTAGDKSILQGCTSHVEGVVEMKTALNKYNYQTLFYPYLNQGNLWREESFYYQLSARGFVNTHSITDGQERMDKLALTESGCVGWLTDNPHLADDYHYGIDISTEKLTLKVGETINTSKVLKLIMGTANADCGLVQVGGNTLVSTAAGYTLDKAGKVTVVYYATRTTNGDGNYSSTYRVYSEPVELIFISESMAGFTPKTSITLSNALIYNVYIPVSDALESFTLDGTKYADLSTIVNNITTLSDGKQYYRFEIELPSPKAARDIVLTATLTEGEEEFIGSFTMSIPKYAKKVIENTEVEAEKNLAKAVLSYVAAAYEYFTKENDAAEIARVIDLISEILAIGGEYEGIPESSGDKVINKGGVVTDVTLNLDAKPTIRFFVTDTSVKFYADDVELKTVSGTYDGKAYVELDVYAYQLCETITFGNGESYHISDFLLGSLEQPHEYLVTCFIVYVESAAAYRRAVIGM